MVSPFLRGSTIKKLVENVREVSERRGCGRWCVGLLWLGEADLSSAALPEFTGLLARARARDPGRTVDISKIPRQASDRYVYCMSWKHCMYVGKGLDTPNQNRPSINDQRRLLAHDHLKGPISSFWQYSSTPIPLVRLRPTSEHRSSDVWGSFSEKPRRKRHRPQIGKDAILGAGKAVRGVSDANQRSGDI